MLCLKLWELDKLTDDKIHSIITELDMVLLTPLPIPTQKGRKSVLIFG